MIGRGATGPHRAAGQIEVGAEFRVLLAAELSALRQSHGAPIVASGGRQLRPRLVDALAEGEHQGMRGRTRLRGRGSGPSRAVQEIPPRPPRSLRDQALPRWSRPPQKLHRPVRCSNACWASRMRVSAATGPTSSVSRNVRSAAVRTPAGRDRGRSHRRRPSAPPPRVGATLEP